MFHSFAQFSIPTLSTAYFNNGLNIQNIIARVTGESASNIDGFLQSNGTANLFLLNPNGIIFGRNALLNIGGSFLASTATSLNFADGIQFSAQAPPTTPPLTMSVPTGLQFGGTAGSILNQSQAPYSSWYTSGLQVQPGKTLVLVGGNVRLDGGNLQAPGGRVELGGVAGAGAVGLNVDGNNLRLSFPDSVARADVLLTNEARVDTNGEGISDIQLQGRRVTISGGSQIEAGDYSEGAGGNLTVTASESVELSGNSADGTGSSLSSIGDLTAGNLTITTGRLVVQDGGRVSTAIGLLRTTGQEAILTEQGGNLTVTASESVELSGRDTGGIDLPSSLSTANFGAGIGGDVTIVTGRLSIRDGAAIKTSASLGAGQSGNLTVFASSSVELIGTSAGGAGGLAFSGGSFLYDGRSRSGLFTEVFSIGDAGNITITTGRLLVQDGARVSASTFGSGSGGKITVNASDEVELVGTAKLIDTVEDFATVSFDDGESLTINADDFLKLFNTSVDEELRSGLFATSSSEGDGGSLTIRTRQLNVRDRAQVSVSNQSIGNAGNLNVAAHSIRLNNQAALTADSVAGEGGNIGLQVQDLLLLRHKSQISALSGTAEAGGSGGNFDINAKFIVSVPSENSDITTNAFTGRGGNVQITAQRIFGTQFREQLTRESDIIASGIVELDTPDVDPSRGLVNLPAELVDASSQIAQSCPGSERQGESEFIVTGRGGLPPSPSDLLNSDALWIDWVTLNPRVENSSSPPVSTNPTTPEPAPIVEAQGWVINNKGEVVLTATAPTATPHIPWLTPVSCHTPETSS